MKRALKTSGYAALAQLECQVAGGSVVLWGKLPSFYLKQMAQEVVKRLGGVTQVTNRVEVEQRRPAGD